VESFFDVGCGLGRVRFRAGPTLIKAKPVIAAVARSCHDYELEVRPREQSWHNTDAADTCLGVGRAARRPRCRITRDGGETFGRVGLQYLGYETSAVIALTLLSRRRRLQVAKRGQRDPGAALRLRIFVAEINSVTSSSTMRSTA
jgi:hypothetical protein